MVELIRTCDCYLYFIIIFLILFFYQALYDSLFSVLASFFSFNFYLYFSVLLKGNDDKFFGHLPQDLSCKRRVLAREKLPICPKGVKTAGRRMQSFGTLHIGNPTAFRHNTTLSCAHFTGLPWQKLLVPVLTSTFFK